MKKIITLAACVVALSFASCSGKSTSAATDSATIVDSVKTLAGEATAAVVGAVTPDSACCADSACCKGDSTGCKTECGNDCKK